MVAVFLIENLTINRYFCTNSKYNSFFREINRIKVIELIPILFITEENPTLIIPTFCILFKVIL